MLVKAFQFAVTRDSSTTIVIRTTEWEAQVLSELFGSENVRKLGNAEPLERAEDEEGHRLASKYGVPVMREVFGADFVGVVDSAVKKAKIGACKTPVQDAQ